VTSRGVATRKPSWLRVTLPEPAPFRATATLLDELRLHTVCDEARCPNRGECFGAGTATFLILGDMCTRDCAFCAVGLAPERPTAPDPGEPRRLAEAVRRLRLAHVVVTSVTRDDLSDGGAAHYAATVHAVRADVPQATVELLVPDFGGDGVALATVLEAGPDVLGHNLETVPRLYPAVRAAAAYERSLELLAWAASWRDLREPGKARTSEVTGPLVKTGLMLGLGETMAEVDAVLADCVAAGVDLVTVGQYLQPAPVRLPVARFVEPAEFDALRVRGEALGLRVVAGPFVRSSYHAAETLRDLRSDEGALRSRVRS